MADRARGLLTLVVLIAVTLPGLWIARRSLFDEDPCSESATIVEETRTSYVPENALFAMLPDDPNDRPLTIDAATDLSFAAQGHGSTPGAERDWRDALVLYGFRGGRLLAWGESASGSGPAIWAHTNEFASAGNALSFHRWAAAWSCRSMADVFRVSGLPGAVGTRFDWRDGHTSEQVSFVRGDLRAVVVATVGELYRRNDLIALAISVYEEIGSPGICETGVHVAPSKDPAPPVRPKVLLDFLPPEVGGASMSNTDHSASFRLLYRETVARAFTLWQGGFWFASLEILQFDSALRAADWTRRTLRFACNPGASVVRPGPDAIAGSLELVSTNPESVTRYIYFLRGPRLYRIAISGSSSEVTFDFVNEVATVINDYAG